MKTIDGVSFFLCLKRKWIETERYKLCFEKYLRFLLSLKKVD
ncbi:hypothetical protein LEP1GSC072_3044 [Leptospira noguchii str. Bonito]|nr:hypothetical protein LEP1GSC072_3044 [Leptospira noguchii str. Bonito]